jgi:hypothetical protein
VRLQEIQHTRRLGSPCLTNAPAIASLVGLCMVVRAPNANTAETQAPSDVSQQQPANTGTPQPTTVDAPIVDDPTLLQRSQVPKPEKRRDWGLAFAGNLPTYRLEFPRSGGGPFLATGLLPGLGIGLASPNGKIGVFFYPGIGVAGPKGTAASGSASTGPGDFLLAPNIAFHFFLWDLGVGYLWALRNNNDGNLRPYTDGLFITFSSLSLTMQQLRELTR